MSVMSFLTEDSPQSFSLQVPMMSQNTKTTPKGDSAASSKSGKSFDT